MNEQKILRESTQKRNGESESGRSDGALAGSFGLRRNRSKCSDDADRGPDSLDISLPLSPERIGLISVRHFRYLSVAIRRQYIS